jgi:hypothetical protein
LARGGTLASRYYAPFILDGPFAHATRGNSLLTVKLGIDARTCGIDLAKSDHGYRLLICKRTTRTASAQVQVTNFEINRGNSFMRKTILLLSGVGIGAGLLYALNRGNKKAAPDQGDTNSGKGEPSSATERHQRNGNGAAAANTVSSIAGSSMKSAESEIEPEIDDRGTGQHEASEILRSVRDAAFDQSDEKLALALGRPTEEIEAWTSGDGTIDGDVVMKARMLAEQRGVEIQ